MRASLEPPTPQSAPLDLTGSRSWVVLVDREQELICCQKLSLERGGLEHWFRVESRDGRWHLNHEGSAPFGPPTDGVPAGTALSGSRINTPTPLQSGDQIFASGEIFAFSNGPDGARLHHPLLPGGEFLLREETPLLVGRASPSVVSFVHGYEQIARIEWVDGALGLTPAGTRDLLLNDEEVSTRRELHDNDVVSFRGYEFRFRLALPREASKSEEALRQLLDADPGDETNWRVYTDLLLEHGDPFGTYLAQVLDGQQLNRSVWLGALAPWVNEGKLELEWDHGHIRTAKFRAPRLPIPKRGRMPSLAPSDWYTPLTQLLALPVSRLLRSLAINLPVFARDDFFGAGQPLGSAPEKVRAAHARLVQLPELPPSLRELSLGCVISSQAPAWQEPSSTELRRRAPLLGKKPLFAVKRSAMVRVWALVPGKRLLPPGREFEVSENDWPRLDVGRKGLTITRGLEPSEPGFFANGQVSLQPGDLREALRVNGRPLPGHLDVTGYKERPPSDEFDWDSPPPNRWGYRLLPGDLIDLASVGRLQFE